MLNTATKIAELNDKARRSLGNYLLTQGVQALDQKSLTDLLTLVRNFNEFTADNDPYAEHDFGSIDFQGERYFWKIDYYDLSLTGASPDPTNESLNRRVVTVMEASEY